MSKRESSDSLLQLIAAQKANPSLDIRLIPVSIFVGRSPTKSAGLFRALFAENWIIVGRIRRLFSLMLNGRMTLVRFADPVSLRDAIGEGLPEDRNVRKLSRVLRTHFRRVRETVVGPDLSTRRMLASRVLAAHSVRRAVAAQVRKGGDEPAAWREAQSIIWEMAADYSYTVVSSVSFMLSFVWNRIYRGVLVHHLDRCKEAALGCEVIYVPSHRSHMDDLLLPYLLHEHGMMPPHIAAGANLNLPLLGSILRRGGAFFIRRKIRGSLLYSTIFSEYLAQLISGGYPLAYFVEGGRSRTGRLLRPMGGMVTMSVMGFVSRPSRPIIFQPVYIGYEKLIEGKSHLEELSGKAKVKESTLQLMRSIPKILRSNYGQVVVNFGEPIRLMEVIADIAPEWSVVDELGSEKPVWLSPVVDSLLEKIQENINRAADVNPINLLAIALLSTPNHAMGEADLISLISLSKRLLIDIPYSDHVTVTPHSPEEIVSHGIEIGILERTEHPYGDVIRVTQENAVLLTYFRNNVLHLFAAASWIACCFQHNVKVAGDEVVRVGRSVYPFMKAELFLPWNEKGFADVLSGTMDIFVSEGLLHSSFEQGLPVFVRNIGQSDEVFRLRAIGHSLQQAFERYYIAFSILAKNGSGVLSAGQLESMGQLAAQRLSLLYAQTAPEFFDKSLFRGFIQKIRELGLVWPNESGNLCFDSRLSATASDAMFVLGRELRHTIERVSPGETGASSNEELRPSG
jgi:glycerol-3-phosphate O-acyltransferase